MEQSCGPDVVDTILGKSHAGGDRRGIQRDAVGTVVRVFVVRDELLQDRQEAEVSLAEFCQMAFGAVIESSHGVGGDDEQASPRDEFGPFVEIEHERS
jgi:hypothetical protein